MQQSSKILYHIYEEWFGDSKSVFTTKLCEAGTEDELRYVRDMIFAMVRRKLRWHNSCLTERRNCPTLKEKLAKDIHDILSLSEAAISSLPKSLFKPENQSHCDQSCQTNEIHGYASTEDLENVKNDLLSNICRYKRRNENGCICNI